jgi:hypothetical protein
LPGRRIHFGPVHPVYLFQCFLDIGRAAGTRHSINGQLEHSLGLGVRFFGFSVVTGPPDRLNQDLVIDPICCKMYDRPSGVQIHIGPADATYFFEGCLDASQATHAVHSADGEAA